MHIDTKFLFSIRWGKKKKYLFVVIDNYSKKIYCKMYPGKTACSVTILLKQVIQKSSYRIESSNNRGLKRIPINRKTQIC